MGVVNVNFGNTVGAQAERHIVIDLLILKNFATDHAC